MFRRLRASLVLLVVVLAASLVLAGPALAKGTKGATLTLSPNPATVGTTVQVVGCGYVAGAPTEYVLTSPTATSFGGVTVASNGCIAMVFYVPVAGSYTLQIYQDPSNRWVVAASATLTAS
jgi:hypothetical protein